MSKKVRKKLLVIASHPVQYQVPLFRSLAKEKKLEVSVLFADNTGLKKSYDKGFGKSFAWDIPLTKGYKHFFLNQINLFHLVNENDYILLNIGWNKRLFWQTLLINFFTNKKIILRAETVNADYQKGTFLDMPRLNIKKIFKKAILPILFRQIDFFLAIGKKHKGFLLDHRVSETKIKIAPYFVDNAFFCERVRKFKNANEFDHLKKKLNLNDKTVFLFSGKFIERKRPLDLILAFNRLKTGQAVLLMVGSGKLLDECKRCAKDRIHFVGFANQKEIIKYYAIADVLVLPSQKETWGLVVNEAFASGLTAIVSQNCDCASDLIKEKKTGLTYPAGDIPALCKIMEIMCQNSESLDNMKQESRKKIQNFSINNTVSVIKEIIL